MGKENQCPGCKQKFQNGRPYSMHIKSCKEIDSAVDIALKKHKILNAKKSEEKKIQIAAIAARRELAAQASQNQYASSSQEFPDDHDMDVDSDQEVTSSSSFAFLF